MREYLARLMGEVNLNHLPLTGMETYKGLKAKLQGKVVLNHLPLTGMKKLRLLSDTIAFSNGDQVFTKLQK